MKYLSLTISLLLILIMMSCGSKGTSTNNEKVDYSDLKDPLIEANKKLVKNEDEDIEDLISRYNWDVKKTGSGLRYMVYEQGKGIKASTGMIATMAYEVKLISGDIVYSSKIQGAKVFEIGKSGLESGIEEGILLLHEGDKAKFILPSHLAFGLLGDEDKIPPKATLIYDIELISLNKKQK